MDSVEITILDQTKPIAQKGFGLPLVLDISKNVPYTEVIESTDIPAPLVEADLAYGMIAAMISQQPRPEKVAVYGYDMDQEGGVKTIAEILDALIIENNQWFFLVLADRADANIKAVAAWAGLNERAFGSSNAPAETVDNIVARAAAINLDNVFIFAHDGGVDDEDPFLDAAIIGRMAPTTPGSATWKYKNLQGVPVATFTNAQISALHTGKVNSYISELGDLVTSEGKTTSGKYIDLVVARYYLKDRITEDIIRLLHTNDKISMDDLGIAQAVDVLKKRFMFEEASGLIAKDAQGNGLWEVSAPNRADIPENDRASRILPDIKWTVTVAGAIHKMKITGVLKV